MTTITAAEPCRIADARALIPAARLPWFWQAGGAGRPNGARTGRWQTLADKLLRSASRFLVHSPSWE